IGSNFIRYILQHYKPASVTNVDALTYAGNLASLEGVVEEHGERYEFFKADIANADAMDALMLEHQFFAVVNFAAESHVDRSINSPENFIHTNVIGTSVLLNSARKHGVQRFVQISTDEVYGSDLSAMNFSKPTSPTPTRWTHSCLSINFLPSSISRPSHTSIAASIRRRISFTPTLSAPACCSIPRENMASNGSSKFPLMKFTVQI